MGSIYPDGYSVDFYGFEVIEFYLRRFLLYYSNYPITTRILYSMILVCVIAMIVLFILFIRRIRSNKRKEELFTSARRDLYDGFYKILISDKKPSVTDLEEACNMKWDMITSYGPESLSRVISEICMDLNREADNVPNADTLCAMTGVKALYEKNLASDHNVLLTLQNMVNLHVSVSEGLLANYINHYKSNVRQMARMCHIISSKSEPYRYLIEDLNEHQGIWRFMMMHRLFGWVWANERQMPQFLIIAKKVQNEQSVAFLIEEVAYWGSDAEKASLHEILLSPNYKYRIAALRAIAKLCDKDQEQAAVESYERQPESIRHEVLRAVHAINSGLYTEFFVNAYRTASSKLTKEIALSCLYTYANTGRRAFELLRSEVINNEEERRLMDQIDAMAILNQMRML